MTRPFRYLLSGFLTLSCLLVHGQSTDVVKLEYQVLPANANGLATERYRAVLNLPFRLSNDSYLIGGLEYNRFDFDFERDFPFETGPLDDFHQIDLNLGYLTKWNETWRFVAILTPRMASNLRNGLIGEDFFLNATATFWKEGQDPERPSRLVLGLTYNTTSGLPIPLPLVNYYRQIHPKWGLTLGVPRSDIRRSVGLDGQLVLALFLDGYFLNVQDDVALASGALGTRFSQTALVAGLGYEYRLAERTKFYIYGGSYFSQRARLKNDERDDTFVLNSRASFFIRSGIKISIF